jgi:hypothetical protein
LGGGLISLSSHRKTTGSITHHRLCWEKKIRYIGLQFATGSADAVVDNVHVWNLNTRTHTFNALGWSGGSQIKILDLGSFQAFDVIGLSIGVWSGVEMMDHSFEINGVCVFTGP